MSKPEVLWHEGCPFSACVLPPGLASLLKDVVEDGRRLGCSSTRPSQRGLIFGWGRCARWGTCYKATDELREKVERLQKESLDTRAAVAMQEVVDKALPMPVPGSQQLFSLNYSPVVAPEYKWLEHPPPQQLCRPQVSSCSQSCDICHLLGCHDCPNCAIHVDRADKSMSIFLGWQACDTPDELVAEFCCGDRSFSLRGGVIVVFDGSHCTHGVWAASKAGTGLDGWYGAALVAK